MEFDHIAISSKNIKRSVEWYVENLSCVIEYQDETWAMLKSGNMKIAIVTKGQHPPHIAFKVSNRVEMPCEEGKIKTHRDGSSYLYGADPDGNIVEWVAYTNDEE